MPCAWITHRDCLLHEMGEGHPECPERLDAISDHLLAQGVMGLLIPYDAPTATVEQLERAHTARHVTEILAASPREGYVHVDPDTSMNPHTVKAALRAAGGLEAPPTELAPERMAELVAAVNTRGDAAREQAYINMLTGQIVVDGVLYISPRAAPEERHGGNGDPEARQGCGELAARLGIAETAMLPLSALHGDLVVERGERMSWYAGPTLMDLLERAHGAHPSENVGLRFPVQWVSRPDGSRGTRRYVGKIEAGDVAVGDPIQVLPIGHPATVREINLGNQTLQRAEEGQSIMLALDRELDISRGDMFVSPNQPPRVLREFDAELCWLAESPLNISRTYLLRHTTREVRAKIAAIHHTLDIKTLEHTSASELHVNALGRVSLRLAQPVAVDAYTQSRATGAFILIDPDTNATVAAGMIR